jgi:hypothetical protein
VQPQLKIHIHQLICRYIYRRFSWNFTFWAHALIMHAFRVVNNFFLKKNIGFNWKFTFWTDAFRVVNKIARIPSFFILVLQVPKP